MAETCNWPGASGQNYTYEVYSYEGDWKDVAGNYIFAKQTSPGRWTAAYVGQTKSFKNRIPNHPEWACAQRHGATHVHAHVNSSAIARTAEESDLIQGLQPPCNQQGR